MAQPNQISVSPPPPPPPRYFISSEVSQFSIRTNTTKAYSTNTRVIDAKINHLQKSLFNYWIIPSRRKCRKKAGRYETGRKRPFP